MRSFSSFLPCPTNVPAHNHKPPVGGAGTVVITASAGGGVGAGAPLAIGNAAARAIGNAGADATEVPDAETGSAAAA